MPTTLAQLIAYIGTYIYGNNQGKITGPILATVLVTGFTLVWATFAPVSFIAVGGSVAVNLLTRIGWQLTPQDFGAVGDGVTDDSAAVNAALTATATANATLFIPAKTYRASSPVVASGGLVQGRGFNPGNPPSGANIQCDASVSPCVKLTGNASLRGVVVSHSGTPAATIIGIQAYNGYNNIIEDVMSYNSGICYQWYALVGGGLGGQMLKTFSGACADAHIDINSWPELRMAQGRYGMNGGGNSNSNAFVRIEGGFSGTAGGPNTLDVENSQFNGGAVNHFVEFVNLGSGGVPAIDATDFKFHGLHVEGVTGADFYSDATWNIVNRVNVTDSSFNDGGVPFLAMNAATQLSVFNVANNQIAGTFSATYSTTASINALSLKNNAVGSTTLTGPATGGGTATVSGNAFSGTGLTLAGSWGDLEVGPDTFVAGSLTNGAIGNVLINEQGVLSSYGKNLAFGKTAGTDSPVTITGGTAGVNPGTITVGGGVSLYIQAANNSVQTWARNSRLVNADTTGVSTYTAVADLSYSQQTPASGFSITLGNTSSSLMLDPAGTLATGTLTMPAAPTDGQQIRVGTSQTITTLTFNANSGQTNKCTAATLSLTQAAPIHCIYRAANTTWYPN